MTYMSPISPSYFKIQETIGYSFTNLTFLDWEIYFLISLIIHKGPLDQYQAALQEVF